MKIFYFAALFFLPNLTFSVDRNAGSEQEICLSDIEKAFTNINEQGYPLSIADQNKLLPQDRSYHFSIDIQKLKKAVHRLEFGKAKDIIKFGLDSHFQGMQRFIAKGGEYFIISGLTEFPNPKPQLIVVKLIPKKSTKKEKDAITPLKPVIYKRTHLYDIKIVKIILIDSNFFHPGGIQFSGNYLAVSAQKNGIGPSEILFFDFSNPEAPVQLPYRISRQKKGASSVGLTRILTGPYKGRFLVAVVGESFQGVDFYLSEKTSLKEDPDFLFNPYIKLDKPGSNPNGGFLELDTKELLKKTDVFGGNDLSYQNISLFSQCDGNVYLLGTVCDRGLSINMKPLFNKPERAFISIEHLIGKHPDVRDVPIPRENWADLFKIDFDFESVIKKDDSKSKFLIKHLNRKKLVPSKYNSDYEKRLTINELEGSNLFNPNFAAATGFFVNEHSKLSIYTTKYYGVSKDSTTDYDRIDFDEYPFMDN